MIREDRDLLVELSRITGGMQPFAMAFLEGRLSQEEQLSFGQKLAHLGETIMAHARQRDRLVVEGSVVGLGEEAGRPRIGQRHELPTTTSSESVVVHHDEPACPES